jgi:hypothetical protein
MTCDQMVEVVESLWLIAWVPGWLGGGWEDFVTFMNRTIDSISVPFDF